MQLTSQMVPEHAYNPLILQHKCSWYMVKIYQLTKSSWKSISASDSTSANDAKRHAWLMQVRYNLSASINPAAKKKHIILLVSLLLLMDPLSRGTHDWLLSARESGGSRVRERERKLNSGSLPFLSRLFTCGWLLWGVRRELRDKGKELLICWCASLRPRLRAAFWPN